MKKRHLRRVYTLCGLQPGWRKTVRADL